MRHHIHVRPVQVRPDSLVIGPDVDCDLPAVKLAHPAPRPPALTAILGCGCQSDRTVPVGEVEPVRDDPLEGRVVPSSDGPVRPTIVGSTHDAGYRHIATSVSKQQRDLGAVREPRTGRLRDPPFKTWTWRTGHLNDTGDVGCPEATDSSVVEQDRPTRLVEGIRRRQWCVRLSRNGGGHDANIRLLLD